jgi:hypothetical protein
MALALDQLALDRELVVFVKKESSYGVLADFAATDAQEALELPETTQNLSFTPSRAKQNTRSVTRRFKDATPAGNWRLPVYCRPSGAAGTPPTEAALWEALCGKETIVASTSVTYGLQIALPSLSLAWKAGHFSTFVMGAMVSDLSLRFGRSDGVELGFSGQFRKMATAGKSTTVADSTTTVIKLATGEAKFFQADARVEVGADDNSGAGFGVTAVDTGADTITITPAMSLAPGAGETVQGFLPTPTLSGDALPSFNFVTSLGGASLVAKEGTINISQEIKVIDAEGTDAFPQAMLPRQRSATGDIMAVFLRNHAGLFTQAANQDQQAFSLTVDGGAGSKLVVNLAQAELDTPELSADTDIEDTIKITGIGATVGENEFSAVFT